MPVMCKASIRPELLAVFTAALVAYGYPADKSYVISSVTKVVNPWKKAGIIEIMSGRGIKSPACSNVISLCHRLW